MVAFNELYQQVAFVLSMKCEDFALQGTHITTEELWGFCLKHLWQQEQLEQLHIHSLIADLFALSVQDYWSLHSAETS